MKKLITLLLLIFMVTPVFAEQEYHQNLNGTYSPCVSDEPIARYRTILYKEYNKRVDSGEFDCSGDNFAQLVDIPTILFMQAFDKKFNGKNYRPDYTEEDFQNFIDEYLKTHKDLERFDNFEE